MTASGMALLAPIPSPTVRMEFCGPAIRALILIIVGFFGDPQQHTGLTRVTTKPRALIAGYRLAPVLSATRRPSHSWVSPTSAGSSPPQPSSSGGLRRRSEWWRSSRPLRPSFQRRKHHRTTEVGAWLRKAVLGYYQYHAVPGNSTQLRIFRRRVCRLWRSVLIRRSQRARVRWGRLSPVLTRWIPPPRILHPYPNARFAATHPR
jgi:hypothetical protein